MHRRLSAIAILAFTGSISSMSLAANMKAGLWEVNNKIHTANGQMEKVMTQMQAQMATMPPEQRKMMEDMMAKHGVSMAGPGPGGGTLVKMCVSQEMAARADMPMQQKGNCTSTHTPVVGGTMKMSFTCTSPASSGEGQITFSSDTAYTMTMNVNSSVKADTMNMEMSGKWLGADCGNIKPIAIPPTK
jgi:hypothetical protein